jgi:hypothetical protein
VLFKSHDTKSRLVKLSLSDAAKLAGISKSALYKALKRGIVSGSRDDLTNEWRIEISELQRVYNLSAPPVSGVDTPRNVSADSVDIPRIESAVLAEKVRALELTLEQVKSERDHLRQVVQAESEERKRLTLALTAPQPTAEMSTDKTRTPRTSPFFWLLLCLVIVGAALAALAIMSH